MFTIDWNNVEELNVVVVDFCWESFDVVVVVVFDIVDDVGITVFDIVLLNEVFVATIEREDDNKDETVSTIGDDVVIEVVFGVFVVDNVVVVDNNVVVVVVVVVVGVVVVVVVVVLHLFGLSQSQLLGQLVKQLLSGADIE